MVIRNYRPTDAEATARIFYETVHTVCAGDYTQDQLDAWAPRAQNRTEWAGSFAGRRAFVAELDGEIVGFGDIDVDISCTACAHALIDRLYVHREHLRKGIASSLVLRLEDHARACRVNFVTLYASVTARPFFEKLGYTVIRENTVERLGVPMNNYLMRKEL